MLIIPYILAVLKYVIYGSSVFFTSALTASSDVLDVLALRFLLSFVFMWLLKVTRVAKINVGISSFRKRDNRAPMLRTLLLTAIFEPVLYMLFETLGISMTTNVTTAIVLAIAPVASCILEIIVLRESCSFVEKVLLGVGIVGVVYVSVKTNTGGGEDTLPGIIFLVLAIISGGFFTVFSRKCSRAFSAIEITYVSAAIGAFAFNSANVIRHIARGDILHYFDPYFSLENMIGFVFLGIVSAVCATGINNYCLGKMQASTMSAFGGLSTVVTIIIGVFIGGETLYYYHYVGMALIFIRTFGVSYISIRRSRRGLMIPDGLPKDAECQKTAQKF